LLPERPVKLGPLCRFQVTATVPALTLISQTHAPDEDYATLQAHFSDKEQVELTLLISAYNAWNRFAIGFRSTHPEKAGSAAA
jgi:alkylhydroperoxidase family enzyme